MTKAQQIIDWLTAHPASLAPEVEKSLSFFAHSYLGYLTRNGTLERMGNRGQYRYRVAEKSDFPLTRSNAIPAPSAGQIDGALAILEMSVRALQDAIRLLKGSYEDQIKAKSIDDLELSVRTQNCLLTMSPPIKTIGDLVQCTESELLRAKGMVRKSLNEIREVLSKINLSLAQSPTNGTGRVEFY